MNYKTAGLALTLSISSVLLTYAKDTTIKIDQAPVEIQKAISKLAGGSKLLKLEKAEDEGVTEYEALTQKKDGSKIEFILNHDGSLNSTEEPIELAVLEGKVAATAKATIGAGKVEAVERVTKNGKVTYEVGYKLKGEEYEAVISSDGKLIKNDRESD